MEEDYASDLSGVSMPSDLTTVSYVQGTFPHVMPGGVGGSIVTSMASVAGLENSPLISGAECNNCRMNNYRGNKSEEEDEDDEKSDPAETTNTAPAQPATEEPAYTYHCWNDTWAPDASGCPVQPQQPDTPQPPEPDPPQPQEPDPPQPPEKPTFTCPDGTVVEDENACPVTTNSVPEEPKD